MLSLEILSKDGTISREYKGEPTLITGVPMELASDGTVIEFTGEQVWLCDTLRDGNIEPLYCVGIIYKEKSRKE